MKFCKRQNLNFLFREIDFLELPQIFLKFVILSIIEKFKDQKILLNNSSKTDTHFGR